MLTYWEPCHIQNSALFRILAYLGPKVYSEPCLYKHIHTYSGIYNNDSYSNIKFIFHFKDICFLTTWMPILMLNWVYLKLVATIFYQIAIFHEMIALQKLWKIFFISSKKLFLFLRYSNFCFFVLPSFFPCQPLL